MKNAISRNKNKFAIKNPASTSESECSDVPRYSMGIRPK